MKTGWPRFDAALVLLFTAALAGCGAGAGGASGAVPHVAPPALTTPLPASGPVAYFQNSSALASAGTIVAGTQHALIAVMSGASVPKAFASDTLAVSTGGGSQTAARAARIDGPALRPAHVDPVEAFPADDRVLLGKVHALAVSAAGTPVRRAQSIVPPSPSVGTTATLWVQKGSLGGARVNVQVPATLLAQTPHTNIWIDSSLSLTREQISRVASDAENAYASDTAHFASPDYTASAPGLAPQYTACAAGGNKQGTSPAYIKEPADHRIDVMVVNSSNLGGLGGYFSAVNVMTQATLNCLNGSGTTYESNEAPFIFVGWFAGSGAAYDLQEDLVRSTAHELQHLINFVNHAILAPGASSSSFNGNEEPYLNEGLSMLAQDFAVERMYGSQGVHFDVDDALSRASVYLAAPSNYSLSAFSGTDPASWGGNGVQYNCGGGCYGAAYLFQRYLRDRFGGDSYTHGMETDGAVGDANLRRVTGESASALFGDFALAMAAGSLDVASRDARFAFGSLSLTGTYPDQFGSSMSLRGVSALPYSGGSLSVNAPVGGFAFVSVDSVPAGGTGVTVTDEATASGFSLEGGLAQK